MTIAYRGYPLSENIIEREDGSIVCLDTVLGRTGFQEYMVGDLPQDRARDLGIDISNPSAKIKVYRSPEEVFHPDHLASIEAGPVTDNHPPGQEFIDPKNWPEYARGHVQNVRRRAERLEDGEEAIIGDVVISAEPLLSDVLNKRKREISMGYDYEIEREGDVICHINLINNHTAVVPKGRAGSEARITDAAPADVEQQEEVQTDPAPASAEQDQQAEPEAAKVDEPAPKPQPITNAEKRLETKPMSKLSLKSLFGLGLMQAAKRDDADPESLTDAALELSRQTGRGSARATDSESEEEHAEDSHRADDRRRSDDRRADDARTGDRRADDKRAGDRRADDRHADDRRGGDARADDLSSRMHAALDRMIEKCGAEDEHSDDADMGELRKLMDNYFEGEGEGEEHPEAELEAEDEGMEPLGEEPEDEEEFEEAEEAEDELGEVAGEAEVRSFDRRAGDVEGFEEGGVFHPIRGTEGYKGSKAGDPKKKRRRAKDGASTGDRARAADARAADVAFGAKAILKALRPVVARSKDSALRSAFNAQIRRANGASRASTGSYAGFASSARDHGRARDAEPKNDGLKSITDYYSNAHNRKTTAEVK